MEDRDIERILAGVETRLRRTQLAWGATTFSLCAALWLASFGARSSSEVLRVRGLVIEDGQGKARILIGAPVPEVAERARKDAASGLVVLDAQGVDRLQIGNVGGPMMGGKVQPRLADATGLMICDPHGNERAGFGYLENGQVGWGLDYEGGEAIVAAVMPGKMAGILINAPVEDGNPTRAALVTGADGTGLRLFDAQGNERTIFEVGALGSPALRVLDAKGEVLDDALEAPK